MLNVGFIKQFLNGEGYSVVYLIWLIINHISKSRPIIGHCPKLSFLYNAQELG